MAFALRVQDSGSGPPAVHPRVQEHSAGAKSDEDPRSNRTVHATEAKTDIVDTQVKGRRAGSIPSMPAAAPTAEKLPKNAATIGVADVADLKQQEEQGDTTPTASGINIGKMVTKVTKFAVPVLDVAGEVFSPLKVVAEALDFIVEHVEVQLLFLITYH